MVNYSKIVVLTIKGSKDFASFAINLIIEVAFISSRKVFKITNSSKVL